MFLSPSWLSLPTPRSTSHNLLLLVFLSNTPLDSGPRRNPINPLHQMWERLHILLREPREASGIDPGPGPNVRNRIFALSVASEVFTR